MATKKSKTLKMSEENTPHKQEPIKDSAKKKKKATSRTVTIKKGEDLTLKIPPPKDMNSEVDILMVIPQPDGSLRIRRTTRSSPILIQHD